MIDHDVRIEFDLRLPAPDHPLGTGDILRIQQTDYCYGNGPLTLRITRLGADPAEFPALEWLGLTGVEEHVMLWSTTRFQQVTNGGSGFTPQLTEQIRQSSATFPDQPSVDYLRGVGVKTVVVLRDRIGGTDLETRIDLPVDYLASRARTSRTRWSSASDR